jgi:hypothetical protein
MEVEKDYERRSDEAAKRKATGEGTDFSVVV